MPMSLLHDIECLCAWNFTCCFLPDICKIPDSPHLIPLLSLYLYSAYCWTSLRSTTFCSISLVFCHSWVPKIPSAKLNMLSPKTLWTNWPDFISSLPLCLSFLWSSLFSPCGFHICRVYLSSPSKRIQPILLPLASWFWNLLGKMTLDLIFY